MHLLATTCATLDEVEDALDLEQTPAQCVVLSFSDSDLTALAHAWKQNADNLPTLRLASLKKLRHPMSVDVYLESVIATAKMVVVRCLGGLDYWRYGLEQISALARQNGTAFAALPGDDRPDDRLAKLSTVSPEALAKLDAFFRAGGTGNLKNALGFLAHEAGQENTWSEPEPVPAISSWPPGTRLDAKSTNNNRPTALIVFYRANVLAADTAPIDALMTALESEGLSPIAVALTSLKSPEIANDLQAIIRTHKPAIILNTTAFSAMRDDDTTVLDEADVPVLQVVLSGSSQEAWDESDRGLGPSDLAMNVVLPELDGRILTRAISFKAETNIDPRIEHASVHNEPLPDRIKFVAKLAKNWARLTATPTHDRRIALVLSDYPARAGRTGYAVGLDTPASVREILKALKATGYNTGTDADNEIDALFLNEQRDTISVPLGDYERWLTEMPRTVQDAIHQAWGTPHEDPGVTNGAFTFPCVHSGNVTILIQPDRGTHNDKKQSYHDTTLPPRHAYNALYQHLRHVNCTDALIHLGTHGTLEWLPGKALALSNECFPEAILGPMPVVYPFIVNNPGEAMQAKRRISAVTLGHLTPPLDEAGLNGALGELEGLVEEYAQADGVDKRRMELLEKEIIEDAWRSGLAQDCEITQADDPREAIAKLDAQLCDIKELSIRDGLHIFGKAPDKTHAASLSKAMIAASNDAHLKDADIHALLQASAHRERDSLLAALDGRRIEAGPAGAPTRGRIDVLPTGRNLTSIDPRAIPTRTAAKIGTRAANEVVRRHLQDFGDYPRALVIDLWASASLRTGGDDLAQAFAYLGVKPVWDFNANRVTGIEVIPGPKLSRPRIDVTLRVSGLFRDIFPTQIALFNSAVQTVAALDEDDTQNPLAAARRSTANEKNLARVFSSAPGSFGAGATDLALDGNWDNADDLANAYLDASNFALDSHGNAKRARDEFLACINRADALIHPQDDRERDILDGDGVADFAGGFAAAAAMVGNTPALYHIDTSRPDAPIARTMNEEITRIVRGRLTNPRWINAMLAHGHRGVSEIAQGVDAFYAFKATTKTVPAHLFDALHGALIADEAVAAKMRELNPLAANAIAERLLDAIERGMWTARRNAVRDELEIILETRTTPPAPRIAEGNQ